MTFVRCKSIDTSLTLLDFNGRKTKVGRTVDTDVRHPFKLVDLQCTQVEAEEWTCV